MIRNKEHPGAGYSRKCDDVREEYMFATNPFADLVTTVPIEVVQTYVVLMFLAVIGGTIFDIVHKRSAKYFFE